MQQRLNAFLKSNHLRLIEKISKGYSSEIFLVKNSTGKEFALKIEKDKSPRKEMVQKEAWHLKLANSAGIGPKLEKFDLKNKIILMEFIEGKTFSDWLFENPKKTVLKKFLKELFAQGKKLDEIHLDHGQLAGKGANILVRNNSPIIIDFEKASTNRRCHNYNQLQGFIYKNPHSAIAKKVKEILEN